MLAAGEAYSQDLRERLVTAADDGWVVGRIAVPLPALLHGRRTRDTAAPDRKRAAIHLGFDGKKFSEGGPIDMKLGERFRLPFINGTMMSHPIHLHGRASFTSSP
jgi:hypothetical protein